MIDILHIYDLEPISFPWDTILPHENVVCSLCTMEDLWPELLQSKPFRLIVFYVSGEDQASTAILQQLVTWLETTGAPLPTILVITDTEAGLSEQSARMAGADFFFPTPIDGKELFSVFRQISEM